MGKGKLSQKQIESTIVWQLMSMDWKDQKKKIDKIDNKTLEDLYLPIQKIRENIRNERNTDWEEISEDKERNNYRKEIKNDKSDEDYEIDYLIHRLSENYRKKKQEEIKKKVNDYLEGFEVKSESDVKEAIGFLSYMGQEFQDRKKEISSVAVLEQMIEKIESDEEQKASYISTGISDFDKALTGGGFETGTLTILAARPSMGKSTLAYNLYFAQRMLGYNAYYISLEGNFVKHINPVLSSIACQINDDLPDWNKDYFNYTEIKSRIEDVNGEEYRRKFRQIAEYLDDQMITNEEYIRDKTREIGYKNDIQNLFDTLRGLPEDTEIVYIDHLHEYDTSSSSFYNSKDRLEKIISTVKNIAQQKDIAVVLLAQLNRNSVSNKQNGKETIRRPEMSDLKSTGNAEQEADNVIMLYRESYQLSKEEMAEKGISDVDLEVLIRKQKSGSAGKVELNFDLAAGFIKGYSIDDELASVPDLSQENQETERLKLEGFSLDDLTNETEEELKESNPKFDSVKNVLEKDKAEVK